MDERFRLSAERALATVGRFDRTTAESILEIAYLAIAADRKIEESEVEAFAHVGAHLVGEGEEKLSENDVDAWLDHFAARLEASTLHDRIAAVASSLQLDDARFAAYRIAFFLGIVDLDASDREFEFDLELIAALGLDQDTADRITAEVNEAITPEE